MSVGPKAVFNIGMVMTLCATACVPWAQSDPSVALAPVARPPQPGELLLVATGDGLAALDWGPGRLVYHAPGAVIAPDGARLAVTTGTGEARSLDLLDTRTGVRQSSLPVSASVAASVVSTDGRWVALAPLRTGSAGWQPAGRERTQLVIAEASGRVEPRVFDLAGNYEPDAFSTDGRRLFVLEYQPPQAPDRYRVRQLDLTTGAVGGVAARVKVAAPEEEMRGTRGMHALSPDRTTLYTLYTHQPDHLHARDLAARRTVASGDVHAFVHVLSLTEGWAYCLDLPQPLGLGPAAAHALALSPDGRSLYVSDRSSGMVVVADTTELVLRRTGNVGPDPRADAGPAAAEVGPDGTLYLAGGAEVLALEPRTLAVERRLAVPGVARGLGASPDGQRLYLSLSDRVIALEATTGAELNSIPLPGAGRIELISPAPAR